MLKIVLFEELKQAVVKSVRSVGAHDLENVFHTFFHVVINIYMNNGGHHFEHM